MLSGKGILAWWSSGRLKYYFIPWNPQLAGFLESAGAGLWVHLALWVHAASVWHCLLGDTVASTSMIQRLECQRFITTRMPKVCGVVVVARATFNVWMVITSLVSLRGCEGGGTCLNHMNVGNWKIPRRCLHCPSSCSIFQQRVSWT